MTSVSPRKMTRATLRSTKTDRLTELVCVCGKRLKVGVPNKDRLPSLLAVALANRWKVEQGYEVKWSNEIDAYCPNCHHHQNHD